MKSTNRISIDFICEQNGEVECDFKSAVSGLVNKLGCKARAYLARVYYSQEHSFGPKLVDECRISTQTNQPHVALCFSSEGDHQGLMGGATKIFKDIFSTNEHLDIIFLDDNQERNIRKVCCPFHTSDHYQVKTPDFYLTSNEGYDLETPRHCFKKKKLFGNNNGGFMLCDIHPPVLGQKYGLGNCDILQVVLASRHTNVSIFAITEWPAYVHVTRPLVNNLESKFNINASDLGLIAWAEIYQYQKDIITRR